ncbi:MAG: hypothetical protein OXH22_01955 [Chloroflexi bacterium]|nr:hypothetical protein [Chloroflexota bacterium]
MDTASVQLLSTVVIIVGLLFAMFALMWQMNSQSGRLEAKIDAQSKDMDAQGKELEAKIDAQGKDIEAQGKELRAEIIAQGQRVSDAELEQARLNGVNSVLTQFAHTHEPQTGDD